MFSDKQVLALEFAMGNISKEEYLRRGGKLGPEFDFEKAEREWKEAAKGTRAWHKPFVVQVPPGSPVPGPTQTMPLIFAVQSVRDGATREADRIFAHALLAIFEELEMNTGSPRKFNPGPTWLDRGAQE